MAIAEAPFTYEVFKDVVQREHFKERLREMVLDAEEAKAVLFADRGARPLAVPFRMLWPKLHPEKPIPAVSFVNIGREKVGILGQYAKQAGLDERVSLDLLTTSGKASEIFGRTQVEKLTVGLRALPPGPRLFVDEVAETNWTWSLAERLFSLLDPKNSYTSFILLGQAVHYRFLDPEERVKQMIPWSGDNIGVQDPIGENGLADLASFGVESMKVLPGSWERGMQARRELAELAREAV